MSASERTEGERGREGGMEKNKQSREGGGRREKKGNVREEKKWTKQGQTGGGENQVIALLYALSVTHLF